MNNLLTVRQLAEYAVSNYSAKDFCEYIVDGEVRVKSYKEFFEDSLAVCRYIRSINKKHIHIAFIGKTNYEYYGGKLLFGEGLRLATDKLNEKNFYAFNPAFDKNCGK